jgi:hypothetical protein
MTIETKSHSGVCDEVHAADAASLVDVVWSELELVAGEAECKPIVEFDVRD